MNVQFLTKCFVAERQKIPKFKSIEMSGRRIMAIMSPFQGEDAGSIPVARF